MNKKLNFIKTIFIIVYLIKTRCTVFFSSEKTTNELKNLLKTLQEYDFHNENKVKNIDPDSYKTQLLIGPNDLFEDINYDMIFESEKYFYENESKNLITYFSEINFDFIIIVNFEIYSKKEIYENWFKNIEQKLFTIIYYIESSQESIDKDTRKFEKHLKLYVNEFFVPNYNKIIYQNNYIFKLKGFDFFNTADQPSILNRYRENVQSAASVLLNHVNFCGLNLKKKIYIYLLQSVDKFSSDDTEEKRKNVFYNTIKYILENQKSSAEYEIRKKEMLENKLKEKLENNFQNQKLKNANNIAYILKCIDAKIKFIRSKFDTMKSRLYLEMITKSILFADEKLLEDKTKNSE